MRLWQSLLQEEFKFTHEIKEMMDKERGSHMYLAIDIGGTLIKHAQMSATGEMIRKGTTPSDREDLSTFQTKLFSIIDAYRLEGLKGIAISCPGTIDVDTGIIYYGGLLPFLHEVNLVEVLERKYGVPITIENDGKCAALAELWLGSIKEKKHAVVLILGSGIGGGIIMDGKIHHGAHLFAGEVSYVMHDINFENMQGRYFGLDCSAVQMIEKIATIKGLGDKKDGEAVFQFIKQNDDQANKIFDDYCLLLASQIINLQCILDPECFAIGGGISAQPILFERITWAINEVKRANPLLRVNPVIVACQFRGDANLYGALYHFIKQKSLRV